MSLCFMKFVWQDNSVNRGEVLKPAASPLRGSALFFAFTYMSRSVFHTLLQNSPSFPKVLQSLSMSSGSWRGPYVVSVQCSTGACTDALPRLVWIWIGLSCWSFSTHPKLQILTGARLCAAPPFHGARQVEIHHFDVTRRERCNAQKTSFTVLEECIGLCSQLWVRCSGTIYKLQH